MAMTGKSRIMIYGPKDDATYVIEFRTAAREALAIWSTRWDQRHKSEIGKRVVRRTRSC